jgi:MFS family permease
MRFNVSVMKRGLSALLALLAATQPAFSQVRSVPLSLPRSVPAVAHQVRPLGASLSGSGLSLSPALTPSLSLSLSAPQLAPAAVPLAAAPLAAAPLAAQAAPSSPKVLVAAAASPAASPALSALSAAQDAPAAPGAAQPSVETEAASGRARFDLAAAKPADAGAAVAGRLSAPADAPRLQTPQPPSSKPPRKGIADRVKVFADAERNRAFWRYFFGEQIYMLGIQMYVVALPYLMSAFTKNTIRESGRPALSPEELSALVRENRSNSRLAHWFSQALSYIATPLFTKGGAAPPGKWLVRSSYIRAGIIFGIPALFFSTGLLGAGPSLAILLGLIGVQSFFQGLHATTSAGSVARIIGDKSVTSEERVRANSIRSLASAVVAIIAPAIAARIASMPDWFGKSGTGSAVIYGVYALLTGLSGLIFAGIKLIGQDKVAAEQAGLADAAPKGVGGALKSVWTSMKEGLKIVWGNRFLRTLLAMNLVASLFTDPLTFNVLPEYVETVLKGSGGALDGLLGVPVLGWFLNGLVSTPMGFFGLLVAFSSVGSVLVSVFINPLRRLFTRLGFKTEEQLTIPFYAIAFLEVLAFWAMIYYPSFWLVLGLYGLQTLASGFAGLIVTGIYQKKLGEQAPRQMTQVLAASSFVSIIAAIASTFLYGYILTDIPVATSLLIAAVATTILGLLRLAAPWLLFTKDERKGGPPADRHVLPPDHRDGHETLPGSNGPLSSGL